MIQIFAEDISAAAWTKERKRLVEVARRYIQRKTGERMIVLSIYHSRADLICNNPELQKQVYRFAGASGRRDVGLRFFWR